MLLLFAFAVNQCLLRDLNGLGDFLLRLSLRHRDGQDAVLHLGRDLVLHNIVRQHIVLLVVRVAELATQVVAVTVLILVFLFVFNGDGEVAVVIDAYAAIFLLDARGCKLHRVGFLTLLDIDCGCCTVGMKAQNSAIHAIPSSGNQTN